MVSLSSILYHIENGRFTTIIIIISIWWTFQRHCAFSSRDWPFWHNITFSRLILNWYHRKKKYMKNGCKKAFIPPVKYFTERSTAIANLYKNVLLYAQTYMLYPPNTTAGINWPTTKLQRGYPGKSVGNLTPKHIPYIQHFMCTYNFNQLLAMPRSKSQAHYEICFSSPAQL